MSYKVPIPYGPNGCQVHIGSQACRETQTLEIIKEFKRVYESKMSELNSAGGGDNVMAKVQLQQDWIRDLTQQNEMLVRAVEELEKEAADRVAMLERRLQTSAQVMQSYKDNCSVYLNETFQKVDCLQNDVCNLVAFIKRVRECGQWNIDGLRFYTINAQCLLRSCSCYCDCSTSLQTIPVREPKSLQVRERETVGVKLSECFQRRLKANSNSKVRIIVEVRDKNKLQEMETRLSQSPKQSDLEELNHKIRLKDEELDSAKRKFEEHCINTEHQIKSRDRYIKDLMQQISLFKGQYAHKDKLEYKSESVEKPINKDTLIQELKKEIQLLKDRITKLERVKSSLSIAQRHRSSSTPSSPRLRSLSPKRKIFGKIVKSLSPTSQSGKRTSKATRYTCVASNSKRTNTDKVSPQRYGYCSCSKNNQDKTVCCRKACSRRSRSVPTSDSLDDSVENAELNSLTKHQNVFENNPFNLQRVHLYNDLIGKGISNLKGTFIQKNTLQCPTDKNTLCGGDSVGPFVKKKNSICTLTANKILHEYYGLSNKNRGVVHNFQEVSTKINLVTIPKRIPIKTYINNLELNIKKGRDNRDLPKKKIQSPRK